MLNFIEISPTSLSLDPSCKVIKRADYQHYLDAQAIIQQAKKQAEDIVEGAQAERQQACDEGYQAGYAAGQQEQSEALLATLKLCEDFMHSRQEDMLELVVDVTRKLLGEVDQDTLVIKLVEQALTAHFNAHNVTLRVAPKQYYVVNEKLSELIKQFPEGGKLDLTEDHRVEEGSCILETPVGVLKSSLTTQLAAVENSLRMSLADYTNS